MGRLVGNVASRAFDLILAPFATALIQFQLLFEFLYSSQADLLCAIDTLQFVSPTFAIVEMHCIKPSVAPGLLAYSAFV